MDRILLVIATFCFLFGFAYTIHALGSRVYRHSRLNFFSILTGFGFQTAFLVRRGEMVGRCPLTSHFEVLIFLSWAMVLFYLLIGSTYRLSLLGAFTSPVVFVFQTTALLMPGFDQVQRIARPVNGWHEMHAAVSLLAYGAFALAGVAGVMYLLQERQLKTHHINSIFYYLPPIRDLSVATKRLIATGFLLLTLGLAAGFAAGSALGAHIQHVVVSVGVWVLYGLFVAAARWHRISGRRAAWLSVAAFSVVLCTLWALTFISRSS